MPGYLVSFLKANKTFIAILLATVLTIPQRGLLTLGLFFGTHYQTTSKRPKKFLSLRIPLSLPLSLCLLFEVLAIIG